MISLELKELLIEAASRYETADFIPKDPVQFPHRYKMKRDIEIAGLVTALMSFGNRKQIIGKVSVGICKREGFRKRFFLR